MKYLLFLFLPASAHSLTVGTTNYMGTVPTQVYQSTSGVFGSTVNVMNLGAYPLVITSTGMPVTQTGMNPLIVASTGIPITTNSTLIVNSTGFPVSFSAGASVVLGASVTVNQIGVNPLVITSTGYPITFTAGSTVVLGASAAVTQNGATPLVITSTGYPVALSAGTAVVMGASVAINNLPVNNTVPTQSTNTSILNLVVVAVASGTISQLGANPIIIASTGLTVLNDIAGSSRAISNFPNFMAPGSSIALTVPQTLTVQSTNAIVNIATGTFFVSTGSIQTSGVALSSIAYHNTTAGKTYYIEKWEGSVQYSTVPIGTLVSPQLLGYITLENPSWSIAIDSIPLKNVSSSIEIQPPFYFELFNPPLPVTGSITVVAHPMSTAKLDWNAHMIGYER